MPVVSSYYNREAEINQPKEVFREKSKPRTGRLPTKEKLNPGLARKESESGGRIKIKSEKGTESGYKGGVKSEFEHGVDPEAGEVCIPKPDKE